jgi:hypothetical protein
MVDSINNRVSMEEVRNLKERLSEINSIPFKSIVWLENGNEVFFSDSIKEEYMFTGLNNADFVMTEFWKEGE